MKRKFELLECGKTPDLPVATDWEKCCICQKETKEKLTCPASKQGAGYISLAQNLLEFEKLGHLPSNLKLSRLNEGKGVAETLLERCAKYHKSCSLLYNNSKLERARVTFCKPTTAEAKPVEENIGRFTRSSKSSAWINVKIPTCFFCDECGSATKPLTLAATLELDWRVRNCANNLGDQKLLAKLSAGDMIAIDAVYHKPCLASLYNKNRNRPRSAADIKLQRAHKIAFCEILAYIDTWLEVVNVAPVLKLATVKKLYCAKLTELGEDAKTVHSTRLKEKILTYLPELEARDDGRNILFCLSSDVGASLRKSCDYDSESDAIVLSRAARILRRDILNRTPFKVDDFDESCQTRAVPHSLLSFIFKVIRGTDLESIQINPASLQACLTASQILVFNTYKGSKSLGMRHLDYQETPLTHYIGCLLRTKIRSKKIINEFYNMGLSESYDSILRISADVADSMVQYFKTVGVVCPPFFQSGVFTTSAVDNIDHNPSSTTSKTSFHGTSISLFQHPELVDLNFVEPPLILTRKKSKKVPKLPETYTIVPAVVLPQKVKIPALGAATEFPDESLVNSALHEEKRWCKHVQEVVDLEANLTGETAKNVSWAVYHSKNNDYDNRCIKSRSYLLPLFPDNSKSTAMIKHSMTVVKNAVHFLNPGQIPVIACDQPLFKLAKEIQWAWPDEYGEDKFVVMPGGLHIKMALENCLGDLLDGSEWTTALEMARVASPGTAESFLKATHIKKTLRAHQVTACALYILRQEAYESYRQQCDDYLSETEWIKKCKTEFPLFAFWQLIMDTQLDILVWDRAVHQGNFELYVASLFAVRWLFHSLDRVNYVRMIAAHLRDMITLRSRHPEVYAQFCKGKFVTKLSGRQFSSVPLDESHEHNNKLVKEEGGAIGLTENPEALLRWMVSGPSMAKMVSKFSSLVNSEKSSIIRHHEDTPSLQMRFATDVRNLVKTISGMGNPFSSVSEDLTTLNSKVVQDKSVAQTVFIIKSIGTEQAASFFEDRLIKCQIPLEEKIKKNSLPLFKTRISKQPSKGKLHLAALKDDRNFFLRMYIGCERRETDLQQLFRHENGAYPPSLSDHGSMRTGGKSDLLKILENEIPSDEEDSDDPPLETSHTSLGYPDFDMVIIDGAAVVHSLKPNRSESFLNYSEKISKHILSQFKPGVQRVDVVFDVYIESSLKSSTRQKRGKGVRRHLIPANKVPQNWADFLHVDENKKELFHFLSEQIPKYQYPGIVVVTDADKVRSNNSDSFPSIDPCTHEEADTRMILHAAEGVSRGYSKILIDTVDTDVVVLAVSFSRNIKCEEMWLLFGSGQSRRYISATKISRALSSDMCRALPAFHAFSGCDTTSKFCGKGKSSAWNAWKSYPDVTEAFIQLCQTPTLDDVCRILGTIERYVIVMYDRCSSETSVDLARIDLFAQRRRELENIPPTQDALHQHLLRVAYQAGHVWGQCISKTPDLPDVNDYGWQRESTEARNWEPRWTTLPPAEKVCKEVKKCRCKNCSRSPTCTCKRKFISCSLLCGCKGCEPDWPIH